MSYDQSLCNNVLGPVVTFSETEVSVYESEKEEKFAEFTLDRGGLDLNTTNLVY